MKELLMAASSFTKNQSGFMMQPQNYSVNDGDGIRTVLFLSGCPLRCKWCANPESFASNGPNSFISEYTIEAILNLIDRQRVFYRFSNGGITFSGGEPTVQLEFLDTLSRKLYNDGFDLAIETCGYFEFNKVKPILERMHKIFVDIKVIDDIKHTGFTEKNNKIILDNIKKMAALSYPVVIRIPVIEGVNTTDENIQKTAAFVKKYIPHPKIELLPYHEFGTYKYEELNIKKPSEDFKRPTGDKLFHLKNIIEQEGVEVVSYM